MSLHSMFQSIPEGAVIFAAAVVFCCANTIVLGEISATTMVGVRNMVLMSFASTILTTRADINPSQFHIRDFLRPIRSCTKTLKVINE